jgi:hypothetical protein
MQDSLKRVIASHKVLTNQQMHAMNIIYRILNIVSFVLLPKIEWHTRKSRDRIAKILTGKRNE